MVDRAMVAVEKAELEEVVTHHLGAAFPASGGRIDLPQDIYRVEQVDVIDACEKRRARAPKMLRAVGRDP